MKTLAPDLAPCSRRSALKTLSVGLLALGALGSPPLSAASRKPAPGGPGRYGVAPFGLPPLPFAPDALAPHIGARTMEIHHGKHHQAYVTNANRIIAENAGLAGLTAEELLADGLARVPENVRQGLRNNLGGHVNHAFFWPLLAAPADYRPGKLQAAIIAEFGSMETFRDEFAKAATGRFGSGWAWLVVRDGRLVVESTANQDSPLMSGARPVIGLDVWEHAYYLDHQNKRGDYVKAFWSVLDWDQAEANYLATRG